MHSQNTIVAVKVNGRVLRETGDTVTLPFQSEFALFVKNLNSVRAQISVSIDGKDVTDGTRLIIEPNSSMDLERFVRNSNFTSGNRFRFIKRTESIEQHRGIGADDGIIRVEVWKELVTAPPYNYFYTHYPTPNWIFTGGGWPTTTRGSSVGNLNNVINTASVFVNQALSSSSAIIGSCNDVQSDAGITVPGSESNQQFYTAAGFAIETQSTVLVLRLRGEVGNKSVVAPVTVDIKPKCTTCGRLNRVSHKFCSNCGTALVLI